MVKCIDCGNKIHFIQRLILKRCKDCNNILYEKKEQERRLKEKSEKKEMKLLERKIKNILYKKISSEISEIKIIKSDYKLIITFKYDYNYNFYDGRYTYQNQMLQKKNSFKYIIGDFLRDILRDEKILNLDRNIEVKIIGNSKDKYGVLSARRYFYLYANLAIIPKVKFENLTNRELVEVFKYTLYDFPNGL